MKRSELGSFFIAEDDLDGYPSRARRSGAGRGGVPTEGAPPVSPAGGAAAQDDAWERAAARAGGAAAL
jgi:hypothetical protein